MNKNWRLLQVIQLKHANDIPIDFEWENFSASRNDSLWDCDYNIKQWNNGTDDILDSRRWIRASHSLSNMAVFRSSKDWGKKQCDSVSKHTQDSKANATEIMISTQYRRCKILYLHPEGSFFRRINIIWQRDAVPPPSEKKK